MKFHDILNSKNDSNDSELKFKNQINDWNCRHLPRGDIFYGAELIVRVMNIMDWTHPQHYHFCKDFGVKLVQVEKMVNFRADTYEFRILFFYADEEDTNFEELEWEKVRL